MPTMTGREKLEAIRIKHLPKGSDAWATCGDKTLLEIARAKLLRYLLAIEDERIEQWRVDPDDKGGDFMSLGGVRDF